MTQAILGWGTVFQTGDGNSPEAFVAFDEVTAISMPKISIDSIDLSHELPPGSYRESISGMVDFGDVTLNFNFNPNAAATAALMAEIASRPVLNRRVVFPNGSRWRFPAYLTGFESTESYGDKLAGSATFKIMGQGFFDTVGAVLPPPSEVPISMFISEESGGVFALSDFNLSSTSLVSDPVLTRTLSAGTFYDVSCVLIWSQADPTHGGIQVSLVCSDATAVFYWLVEGPLGGQAKISGDMVPFTGGSGTQAITLSGRLLTQSAAPTLTVRLAKAQVDSPATDTIRKAGSSFIANPIASTDLAAAGVVSIQIPTTGFSISIASNVRSLVLNPAAMLTSGTVTMPASPISSKIDIRSTQPISSFTVAGTVGQTIRGAPNSLAAGQEIEGIYDAGTSTWFFG